MNVAAPAPVFNLEAQQALLGAMLVNDDAAKLAPSVLRDDLYREREQLILDAIVRTLGDGAKPDVVTVAAQFADDEVRSYVRTLPNLCPTISEAPAYLKIVRDEGETRRLREAIRDIQTAADANGKTPDELRRYALELLKATEPPIHGAAFEADPSAFIDWPAFWAADHDQAEWVYPDVLARGRGHALYAAHKLGKSLFMLWVAAQLATGAEPNVVIYLDYEMTEADVHERLEDMGYGPASDLCRLRYALLPTLQPLDTAGGARELLKVVDAVRGDWPGHHVVVIVDTIGRAVQGEENPADTIRDFYRHSGIALKRRGITWARLDHAGKDAARGQRGSSAKGDDVDVIWELRKTENGVCLHRDVSRMGWVPDKVTFGMDEDPLRYRRLTDDYPAGTGETANLLDRLDVPLDASSKEAAGRLRDVDEPRRKQVVLAALRYRRDCQQGVRRAD